MTSFTSEPDQDVCHVCGGKARSEKLGVGQPYEVTCPSCGKYHMTETAFVFHVLKNYLPSIRFAASHKVRRTSLGDRVPLVTDDFVQRVIENPRLPSPAEQADYAILALGTNSKGPGLSVAVSYDTHGTLIGAATEKGLKFILQALVERGLIALPISYGVFGDATLTFEGWERFEEIKHAKAASRKIFIAMPFNQDLVERACTECFRVAAKRAGFTAQRVDDDGVAKAGLIDDNIRVEILTSALVIADLTDWNPGVYWEAGFAEGLGKPVLYTCERSYFEKYKSHFDTNHRLTVDWDSVSLGEAAKRLASAIRATLPELAVMEDRLVEA